MSDQQKSSYWASARWGGDGLAPAAIGDRVLDLIDRTAHLVPPGQRWYVIDDKRMKYSLVTRSLGDIVETNEVPGDFGDAHPGWGYGVCMFTMSDEQGPPSGSSLALSITAGATSANSLTFEVGDSCYAPDYAHLNYQTFREMMGALAETLPCPWILACNYRGSVPPADAAVNGLAKPPFGGAWIAYLSAPHAKGLAPPPELVAEPTAGGGLFLSATQTLLDQSNPDDMRRSRVLERISEARIGYNSTGGLVFYTPARVGPA